MGCCRMSGGLVQGRPEFFCGGARAGIINKREVYWQVLGWRIPCQ